MNEREKRRKKRQKNVTSPSFIHCFVLVIWAHIKVLKLYGKHSFDSLCRLIICSL